MTDDARPDTPRALAAALNLSPESLRLYRKLKGAPEGWNVEEWRGFVDRLGLARAGNATLNELKAELQREQIHLARAKNRREREAVVARETVREMLGLLGQKLDLLLRLKLEVELPSRCLGKNAAEIGIEGAAILDEIREVVNGNLARFETDAVKASAGPEALPPPVSPSRPRSRVRRSFSRNLRPPGRPRGKFGVLACTLCFRGLGNPRRS